MGRKRFLEETHCRRKFNILLCFASYRNFVSLKHFNLRSNSSSGEFHHLVDVALSLSEIFCIWLKKKTPNCTHTH